MLLDLSLKNCWPQSSARFYDDWSISSLSNWVCLKLWFFGIIFVASFPVSCISTSPQNHVILRQSAYRQQNAPRIFTSNPKPPSFVLLQVLQQNDRMQIVINMHIYIYTCKTKHNRTEHHIAIHCKHYITSQYITLHTYKQKATGHPKKLLGFRNHFHQMTSVFSTSASITGFLCKDAPKGSTSWTGP